MSLPIVFLHRGAGVVFDDVPVNYTNLATLQARLHNLDGRICVIGDKACRDSLLGFQSETANLEDFDTITENLRPHYRHCSPNNPEIEFLCIARWFILREWMKRQNVARCLHLDTDVLLYESADTVDNIRPGAGMVLSLGCSGGNSVVTIPALDAFCDAVLEFYTTPSGAKGLDALIQDRESGRSQVTVSDMYFYELVGAAHPELFVSVSAENTSPAIDSNINLAEGFQTVEGRKRIEFRDSRPFAFRADTGDAVRFSMLHFQGGAKATMHKHVKCPPERAALGAPLLQCMSRYREDMRDANVRFRSLSNAHRKAVNEINSVNEAAQSLQKNLRRIRQSSWIKLGGVLRTSSAQKHLLECEQLGAKIKKAAHRKELPV